jgi:hypothetical protein
MPAFSKTTTERIAACASVGLHFWSDSPARTIVWATGDDQRFHLVRLDRTTRTATHVCGEKYEAPGMMTTYKCWYGLSVGRWADVSETAATEGSMLAAAASLLGR